MWSFSVDGSVRLLKGHFLWGSFSVNGQVTHLKGHPDGVLLCRWACQALKGAHWEGSFSAKGQIGTQGHHGWGPTVYFVGLALKDTLRRSFSEDEQVRL